jgi:hypothetical protein
MIYLMSVPVVTQGLMPSKKRQRAKIVDRNLTPEGFVTLPSEKLSNTNNAWKGFFGKYGTDVNVIGRPDSGDIHRIFNGNIKIDIPRGFTGDIEVKNACILFISENQEIFNLSIDEIKHLKSTHRGGMWFVDFGQAYRGIPVFGSKISFILSDNGRVLSITMNYFPGVDLPEAEGLEPEKAISVANSDLGTFFPSCDFELVGKQLIVYPIRDKGMISFVWAWHLDLKCPQPIQKWQYIIEADTGMILSKKDPGRYLISGQVKGQVLPRYSDDNPVEVSLPNLKVICLHDNPPLMYQSLDTNPGWLGTNPVDPYGWNYGQPTTYPLGGAGGPGPEKGHTGNNFYGFNLNGYYPLNMWSPQYLTTLNPINCSGKNDIYLRFWRWLGVEGSEADSASLEIADGPTSTWWKIWQNPEENIYDAGWRLILYDISKWADGRENIFLRWGMGPTNGYVSYCGWNIDDIGVYTSTYTVTDQEGIYEITGEASKNVICSYLQGNYFKVINEDGANVIHTKSDVNSGASDQDMNFTRVSDYDVSTKMGTVNTLSDIDEINVYYHANRLVSYIQEIDPYFWSESSNYFPIPITIRYEKEYTNSFWLAGEGVFLGEGDKLEYSNFAHFADIIYHECSHAVTDSIYGNLDSLSKSIVEGAYAALARFSEFDAMHEAFSDYWACTITNDSKIADGGFWIDHDSVRDLENNLNYIQNYGLELYQSSLILSGAMWDLRQALRQENGDAGIRIADTLFHFARLATPNTYLDFLVNVLIVDQVTYDSSHRELIKDIFGQRGISQAPSPPNSLIVTIQNQGANIQWNQSADAIGYNLYYGPTRNIRPLIGAEDDRDALYMQDGGGGDSSSGDMSDSGDRTTDGGGGMEGGGSSSSSSSSSSNQNPSSNPSSTQTTTSKLDVGNTTNYFLTGLDPTLTYTVQVAAYNIYGVESPPSEESIIPGTQTTGTGTGSDLNTDSDVTGAEVVQGVTCFISSCQN